MFLRCSHCGNIITHLNSTGVAVVCCGVPMDKMVPNTTDGAAEKHVPLVQIKRDENKTKIKIEVGEVQHPSSEEHYIQWIAVKSESGLQFKWLKAGDEPKAKFVLKDSPLAVYEYCNLHGLWVKEL